MDKKETLLILVVYTQMEMAKIRKEMQTDFVLHPSRYPAVYETSEGREEEFL